MKSLEERRADRATRAQRNAEAEGRAVTDTAATAAANAAIGGIAAEPTAAENNGGGDGTVQDNTATKGWAPNA